MAVKTFEALAANPSTTSESPLVRIVVKYASSGRRVLNSASTGAQCGAERWAAAMSDR